ncbi:MAG: hypothetical protein R3D84_18110 [Paracoccaceae bacterium]
MVNIHFFDTLEALKTALLERSGPVQAVSPGSLPWPGVIALLALAGWRLGGLRLATLVAALALLIAATGQWEKAMITVSVWHLHRHRHADRCSSRLTAPNARSHGAWFGR